MDPIITPIALAIYGTGQGVGHVLNWYARKQDGTFGEQQRVLAQIRREDAQRAYDHVMARDAQQAELTLARDQYLSQLRIEEGVLESERAKDLASVRGEIKQAAQIERERRDRELANSPFDYSPKEAHERVSEHTRDGAVPVFLIAPFRYEDKRYRGPNFELAFRQAWQTAPWAADMKPLGGLIARPLFRTDVDVQTIRMALDDLPVVLVHGQVQANLRAWVQVVAWNLGDTSGTRVLEIDLPPMLLPASDEAAERQLEFQDSVAEAACLIAGAYADWFHILTYGRTPKLHQLLPSELEAERRLVATSGAALYQACVSRGMVSDTRARIVQAIVLAEAGLVDKAVDRANDALCERDLLTAELPDIGRLLGQLAAGPVGDRLSQPIDDMRRYVLLKGPEWGM